MTHVHRFGDAALFAKMADLPVIITGRVPRAENEACLKTPNRVEQLLVIVLIVFEIGVLDNNDVAAREFEAFSDGVPFS